MCVKIIGVGKIQVNKNLSCWLGDPVPTKLTQIMTVLGVERKMHQEPKINENIINGKLMNTKMVKRVIL